MPKLQEFLGGLVVRGCTFVPIHRALHVKASKKRVEVVPAQVLECRMALHREGLPAW